MLVRRCTGSPPALPVLDMSSPRPPPWLGYVFTAPEMEAEAGVWAVKE